MYNLIVIDMQTGFSSAKEKWLIDNAVAIIKKAVEDDANIIFVEYLGYGPTLIRLKEVVIDHERVWTAYKDMDDGGRAIKEVVEHAGLDTSAFHYIGVNLCSCVLDTSRTLCGLFDSDHKLFTAAANTCHDCNIDEDLAQYTHLELVHA